MGVSSTSSPSPPATSAAASSSAAAAAAIPHSPAAWVSFTLSIRGNDPDALMNDSSFVCAMRVAFAHLASVSVASVRVVGARSEGGAFYPVSVSQAEGTCITGANQRLLSTVFQPPGSRRTQSLPQLNVEVEVDASQTSLASTPTTAGQVVRSEIERVFFTNENSSLIDSLFYSATFASCAAQGIPPHSCPNPPSAVLSIARPSQTPAGPEDDGGWLPAVIGGVVGALVVLIILGGVWGAWWRKRRTAHQNNTDITKMSQLPRVVEPPLFVRREVRQQTKPPPGEPEIVPPTVPA